MFLLAQDAGAFGSLGTFLPLLLIGGFFWFVMIRPQRKRAAERKDMMDALAVGSSVITIGGIHGVVDALDDEWVDLLVTDDVVLRFTRAAIGQVVSPETATELDDLDDLDDFDDDLDDGIVAADDGATDEQVEWPADDDRA
ncbi:MAG TPA: preprotein translocase subunit YajC [Nitriliruptoraceae bacterium]|nr:preprotein translocase subunit YajC [Nitriliruptoraceae bacterium]